MTRTPRAPLPLWLAVLLAIAAGPVLDAGFPDKDWWPLTFVGIAMVLLAQRGRRAGSAFLVGWLAGESFYLVHVAWTALYLGPVPWVALSTLEALFWGVGGILITLAYRWVPRAWPGVWGRVGLLPVIVAGLWVLREYVTGNWPYGGFSWGRVAESQSLSPFAPLVAWLGISGLSFVMVWLVALIVELAFAIDLRAASRAGLAIGAVALVLVIPAWPTPTHGTTRIAAVQGNGPAGYFDDAPVGAVLDAQVAETLKIADQKADIVVWPEGAALPDPTRDPASAAILDALSRRMDATFVVGTITARDGKYFNSSLQWVAGKGAVDYYDKKHPVPFGEYVPDRAFWRPFAPDLIDLIGRDYTPGTRDNVFDIDGVRAGISICFDIVDDQLLTDMMQGGAQVILAQTNNADFGQTDENQQQLAIARLRAIEAGRALVNISTVGSSQIIAPDGRTISEIPPFTPGNMIADVPLGTTTTPATLLSRGIEFLVAGLGLFGLLIAAGARRNPAPDTRRPLPPVR
ncbi:apolipoprotein N-acyltransferase [Leifsonia aquatica]|uniref:Apolipoprotein N-acyltransferase n=2 Tax=Leifsonia aquatica TaxID=144185 RepID=U2T2G8_LEIAQ|nr:apolipoprotein N-acyltransferase [Leifsonia aquatica]ERK71683.1 apolipoprotein N-acyltransferase [Leifsonia aquatica ATCC 14665]MBB2966504.1 apolipoprotein N-acyltransferase [Leifsonia aquatica]